MYFKEKQLVYTNPMYSGNPIQCIHPEKKHPSCIVKCDACGGENIPNVWFVALYI